MPSSREEKNALLTEHFRYTPLTLLDDIINTVNELVYRAVNAVEEGLSNAPAKSLGFAEKFESEHPGEIPEKDDDGSEIYPDARTEIETGVHQLETLLQAAVDKNFDKFEIYVLRNILTIPDDVAPYIRLAHYEDLPLSSLPAPNDPQQPTPESLRLLRRKLTETRKLHNALLAERSRNEAIINQLQALLQPQKLSTGVASDTGKTDPSVPSLSFLTSSAAAKSLGLSLGQPDAGSRLSTASSVGVPPTPRTNASINQPLTTRARFLISQLPALRQLVSELRSKMADEGGPLRHARASSASDERREYIEGRVKKLLEEQGIDITQGASGVLSLGKRPGVEEIRSMEGVAEMVGAGEKDANPTSNERMEI